MSIASFHVLLSGLSIVQKDSHDGHHDQAFVATDICNNIDMRSSCATGFHCIVPKLVAMPKQ